MPKKQHKRPLPTWARRLRKWASGTMPVPTRPRFPPRPPLPPDFYTAPIAPGVYFWGERITPDLKRSIQHFVRKCLDDLRHWTPNGRLRSAALLGPERWYAEVCARALPFKNGVPVLLWDSDIAWGCPDIGPSIYNDLLTACRAVRAGTHVYRCVVCKRYGFSDDGRRQACPGTCSSRRDRITRRRRRRAALKTSMLDAIRKNPRILTCMRLFDEDLPHPRTIDVDSTKHFQRVRRAFAAAVRELQSRSLMAV
jgi:hypothetical protein